MVMDIFYSNVIIRIVHKKEGHLLHELLRDTATIRELHRPAEPAIKYESNLLGDQLKIWWNVTFLITKCFVVQASVTNCQIGVNTD